MARESKTPYAILGCLTVRPMSGYDVKRFLERPISHFWSESYGQIYPTLKRMEADGLVEGRDESEGERERRVYTITPAGRETLRDWLGRPSDPPTIRSEPSLKIFFGANAPLEVALAQLRSLRAEAEAFLSGGREREQELEARLEERAHVPYFLAVLRGGIRWSEMVVGWCDEAEALLREHADTEPAVAAGPDEREAE